MNKLFFYGLVIIIVMSFVFCSDEGLVPYKKEFVFPAKNISYSQHVLPMVDAKCGFGSGCHNASNKYNLLNYATRDIFINHRIGITEPRLELVNPEIDRFNPKLAPLYQLLTVEFDKLYLGYERMPPLRHGRKPLSEQELKGIEQWISEGAPN